MPGYNSIILQQPNSYSSFTMTLLAASPSLNLDSASITVASRTRSLDPGKLNGPQA